MERTPSNSGEDDDSKPRKGIESYFSSYVPPVESKQRPLEATGPEPRRMVPFIPAESILLFDRQEDSDKKDTKETEKDAQDAESSEEETSESGKTKKSFRPVIPRVPVAGVIRPLEVKSVSAKTEDHKEQPSDLPAAPDAIPALRLSPEQPAPPMAERPLHDAFGELPAIEGPADEDKSAGLPPSPAFAPLSGDLFKQSPSLGSAETAPDDDEDLTIPASQQAQASQPHFRPPSPNTQASTANQWPHYAYYSPNTPPPNGGTGGGAQPPVPPRPPTGMGMGGNVPPLNPNIYPLGGAGGTGGSGPNYNAAPAAANIPPVPAGVKRRAVDPLARLMGVGNWIGNRRTRKNLGSRINQLQSDTGKNMADLQARQDRFEQKQRSQSQEMQRMQTQAAERAAIISAVPLTAENGPRVQAARGEATRFNTPNKSLAVEMHPQAQQQMEQEAAQHIDPETKRTGSFWLQAEVNKRGEVITKSSEYGSGFHNDRKEVQRDRLGDSAAAGAVSLMGIQQDQHAPIRYDSSLPSGMTTPRLPQGMPTHIDPQHQLAADNKKTSAMPGPVFWIMLAVIIAAFFAAAFI